MDDTTIEPIQPCAGAHDAYHDTVRPIPMCQDCYRWLMRRTDPPTPTIEPRVEFGAITKLLICGSRIQG